MSYKSTSYQPPKLQFNIVQLNKNETAPHFFSNKPKLDVQLFAISTKGVRNLWFKVFHTNSLFSGRLSLYANQKSQTHNVILGGYAMIRMFDENGDEMYVEQSLG